ncbi:hypothetical protein F5879DRAFT_1072601 [Lentinula edodes]|nr:hypothetical protein F5879DRAFT_1072601 [Lentinula edodes]
MTTVLNIPLSLSWDQSASAQLSCSAFTNLLSHSASKKSGPRGWSLAKYSGWRIWIGAMFWWSALCRLMAGLSLETPLEGGTSNPPTESTRRPSGNIPTPSPVKDCPTSVSSGATSTGRCGSKWVLPLRGMYYLPPMHLCSASSVFAVLSDSFSKRTTCGNPALRTASAASPSILPPAVPLLSPKLPVTLAAKSPAPSAAQL